MRIWLLRHAEAEAVSPTGRDADRRLTEAGAHRMKAVARAIARLDPGFDAVLVSPLVRARQTAAPVLDACGFRQEAQVTDTLLPDAEPALALAEAFRTKGRNVLLVGHEPHMGRAFCLLLTGREQRFAFKKAALACFECAGDPSRDASELRLYLPGGAAESLVHG